MISELDYECVSAIRSGDIERLRRVAKFPTKLCEIMPYGECLMYHAAILGQNLIVEYLIDIGCNPDQTSGENGWAPLHVAAHRLDCFLIDLLVSNNASIEIEDKFGSTPLARAVYSTSDDLSAIELLVSYGSNPFHKDSSGISPYNLAEMTNKRSILTLFGSH